MDFDSRERRWCWRCVVDIVGRDGIWRGQFDLLRFVRRRSSGGCVVQGRGRRLGETAPLHCSSPSATKISQCKRKFGPAVSGSELGGKRLTIYLRVLDVVVKPLQLPYSPKTNSLHRTSILEARTGSGSHLLLIVRARLHTFAKRSPDSPQRCVIAFMSADVSSSTDGSGHPTVELARREIRRDRSCRKVSCSFNFWLIVLTVASSYL